MKRIILNIGELAVSKESAALETILGSCVAVCLWDEQQRIGGLNHYLLPNENPGIQKSTLYGATSIDTLIGQMVALGSKMGNMRAHIFGGSKVNRHLDELFAIGVQNVLVARERLEFYGIPVVGEHIRDTRGIKVILKTATGEIVIRPLGRETESVVVREAILVKREYQLCKACIKCGSCEDHLNGMKDVILT